MSWRKTLKTARPRDAILGIVPPRLGEEEPGKES